MSRSRIDLTGRTFGCLTVLRKSKKSPLRGISKWECRCTCGNVKPAILYTSLVRGDTRSCGACNQIPKGPSLVITQIPKGPSPAASPPPTRIRVRKAPRTAPVRPVRRFGDQTGKTFGRWTVLEKHPKGPQFYTARCSCGNTKVINVYAAIDGKTTSCGCYRVEHLTALNRKYPASEPHLQHTQHNPLYAIWMSIKTRCFNSNHPSYQRYGARGITMDLNWKVSFLQFARHVGPRPSPDHSIDRIDNNLSYIPGNLRWGTRTEQAENTRNNPEVQYLNQTLRLRDLADQLNIDRSILRFQHIIQGLPLQEAITKSREVQANLSRPLNPTPSVQKPHTSFIDHTGLKINGYTVIQYQGRKHRTSPAEWLLRCDSCGSTKVVLQTAIKKGTVRSCGCQRKHTLLRQQQASEDFC